MKYRPAYPARAFTDLMSARQWVGSFVHWYNAEHRHSAIGFVTPEQHHAGLDAALLRERTVVYRAAKTLHPNRWSGEVRNWKPVEIVHLNPEKGHSLKSETERETLTLKSSLNHVRTTDY